MQRGSALELPRRPLRVFQKQDNSQEDESSNNNGAALTVADIRRKAVLSTTKREAVCELMSRTAFGTVMRLVMPDIKVEEATKLFAEACEWAHNSVLRTLELMWLRCIDDGITNTKYGISKTNMTNNDLIELDNGMSNQRKITNHDYHINLETGVSQWMKPYRYRTFYCHDLEIDSFLYLLIRRDIFLKR